LDADIDIIFPFKVKNDGITEEQIKLYYGDRVKNVWFLPQPSRLTVAIKELAAIHKVKIFVKEILYQFCRNKYNRIFTKGNYDFIHINSVILYSMLDKKWPMYLHVREIVRPEYWVVHKVFEKKMNQAHGIIYIDQECRKSCPNIVVPQMVLVNPFDQRNVKKVQVESVRNKYQLDTSKTIYAIIGNIFPWKGVGFVAEAFIEAQMDDAILLIVGRDTNNDGYEDNVKAIANGRQNIRFLGEVVNMDELYRIIDFVVRGDPCPGAGRTVFESLFSGAGVILPGVRSENLDSLCIDQDMSQRVFYYSPRNKSELISLFQQTNGTKYFDRTYSSNLEEYTEKFLGFVLKDKD
jgi:hypothetical protein